MWNNIHPNQISFFDTIENGIIIKRVTHPCHSTYHSIISLEHLLLSWQEFLRGKRKRKDVAEFSVHMMDNIVALHKELKDKTYRHGKYYAFTINDPKPRDIHKALVRDRIVHHALYRALYSYFDSKFISDSYSCRLNKGTHKAMNRFRFFGRKVSKNNTQTAWILKCDIKKFFATIDHKILKQILRKHIVDEDVIWLFEQVIDSFHTEDTSGIGLPLGNVTSQLLINIYMNEFDQFVKRQLKVRYYIRYADDFVLLHEDMQYLVNLIPKIANFLEKELQLSLHPNKVSINTFLSGVDFLGWVHFPHHRVLRTSTKRRMFKKLSQKSTQETVVSYLGMLTHGNTYTIVKKIKDGDKYAQFSRKY